MRRALCLLLLLPLGGCVRHVLPYTRKSRAYTADTYAPPTADRSPGSLWSDGAHNLFEDARARRIGDIVTVRVDERSNAVRDAATRTHREGEVEFGVSSFAGAMQQLAAANPGLNPATLLGAGNESTFRGQGNTSRSGRLQAILPVRIKGTMPNGDFYIEGNKVLLLNEEESFLYISGVIRPIDIEPDNSVVSSVIADVELEYTGRGSITESQNRGWLSRILDYLWPF